MQANPQVDSSRYAKVIEVSRRVRWEIERVTLPRFDVHQATQP